MGWWSAEIMGGDTPLDCVWSLNKALGLPTDIECIETSARTGRAFKLDQFLEKTCNVGKQVAGWMILKSGADMSVQQKAIIVQALDNDEWMKEDGTDSERGHKIQQFKKLVLEYDPADWKHAYDTAHIVDLSRKIENISREIGEYARIAEENQIGDIKLYTSLLKASDTLKKAEENLTKSFQKAKMYELNPILNLKEEK